MKVRPHPLVLLVALVALLVAVPGASAASSGEQSGTATPAATKSEEEPSAAERRAASSEFEREKLDPEAFAGADDAAEEGSGGDAEASSGGSILRFVFGLVVVLGVIFGVHWLLKQWGQSRLQGVAGRSGVIDVVATTPLAQGRSLHLVRVGSELVLVGATEQSITRIGEMDAGSLGAMAADRGNGEFQAMLNGAMVSGQPGVPAGMGGASSASQPFLRRFLDNLRMSTAR